MPVLENIFKNNTYQIQMGFLKGNRSCCWQDDGSATVDGILTLEVGGTYVVSIKVEKAFVDWKISERYIFIRILIFTTSKKSKKRRRKI